MGSVTRTATLPASADEVFAIVSVPEQLTGWCADFAREVRRDGEDWTVVTPIGPVRLYFSADAAARTVDLRVTYDINGEHGDHRACTRVLDSGEGGSEYVYTRIFGVGEDESDAPELASVIETRLKALSDLF
ncbi:hypothetical protein [Kitasatospora sp. HPMI-4]|jgi:uncharacterized protein YndB with AHSA1/START domain|uniref:hypothetical protein n=1 Tax=Kitasatospora sp. HPMI-4 TaxID=3448443 RepID=UPI003F1B2E2F